MVAFTLFCFRELYQSHIGRHSGSFAKPLNSIYSCVHYLGKPQKRHWTPPWLTPGAFANIFMQVTQTSIPIIHNPEIRFCFLIFAAVLLLGQSAVHNKKHYLTGIYHPVCDLKSSWDCALFQLSSLCGWGKPWFWRGQGHFVILR